MAAAAIINGPYGKGFDVMVEIGSTRAMGKLALVDWGTGNNTTIVIPGASAGLPFTYPMIFSDINTTSACKFSWVVDSTTGAITLTRSLNTDSLISNHWILYA